MYLRTSCSKCSNPSWHDIHIVTVGDSWEDIYLKETVSEEAFVAQIIKGVKDFIKDGIKVSELCRLLVDIYGIAKNFCCDLIQRIKLELGLYSPDGKHLYYAKKTGAGL